jgi:hypothetical protein
LRFIITTLAPLERSSRVASNPAPALAPVITYVLPAREPICSGVQPFDPLGFLMVIVSIPLFVCFAGVPPKRFFFLNAPASVTTAL